MLTYDAPGALTETDRHSTGAGAGGAEAARLRIARRRLHNERLVGAPLAAPTDVVRWLGAVQAQDWAGAKWAVAQRTRAATDADVEGALADGAILRTHVLRPTWHLVMPEDIRWMLALSAARVRAAMAPYERKLDLDARLLRRCQAPLVRALGAEGPLTRAELARAVAADGLAVDGQRLGHALMHAELDAAICSGPRRGKQLTYALLDARVPAARPLSRERALAELTRRYFASHGPALARDFAWWSGLRIADANEGLALAGGDLASETVGGKTYWSAAAPASARTAPASRAPAVHLLPNYDEVLVAYRDHDVEVDASLAGAIGPRDILFMNPLVLVDGRVAGGWRRTLGKRAVSIELRLLRPLSPAEKKGLHAAAERYGRFLGLPVSVVETKRAPRSR
jgi:hypothetical protein